MAKRRSREEMREGSIRLLADFDAQPPWAFSNNSPKPNLPKWTACMHLQSIPEAANDGMIGIEEAIAEPKRDAGNELAKGHEKYRKWLGQDFFVNDSDRMWRNRAVLACAAFKNEEEWQMINKGTSDLDSEQRSNTQLRNGERALAAFEDHAAPDA